MTITITQVARVALFSLAFVPTAAFAELKSEMQAFVVTTDPAGVEQYQAADAVKPGQTVIIPENHRVENWTSPAFD